MYGTGAMMYDTQTNCWELFNNIKNHEQIMNRTGHCALPTALGCLFFGGLREDKQYTAEVINLNLFSAPSSKQYSQSNFANHEQEQERSFLGSIVHSVSNSLNLTGHNPSIESPSIRVFNNEK